MLTLNLLNAQSVTQTSQLDENKKKGKILEVLPRLNPFLLVNDHGLLHHKILFFKKSIGSAFYAHSKRAYLYAKKKQLKELKANQIAFCCQISDFITILQNHEQFIPLTFFVRDNFPMILIDDRLDHILKKKKVVEELGNRKSLCLNCLREKIPIPPSETDIKEMANKQKKIERVLARLVHLQELKPSLKLSEEVLRLDKIDQYRKKMHLLALDLKFYRLEVSDKKKQRSIAILNHTHALRKYKELLGEFNKENGEIDHFFTQFQDHLLNGFLRIDNMIQKRIIFEKPVCESLVRLFRDGKEIWFHSGEK